MRGTMNTKTSCVLAVIFLLGCGGASSPAEQAAAPAPASGGGEAAVCGWRGGASQTCAVDGDCPSDQRCAVGAGRAIDEPRPDGVENMPPYERETVHFCQSRACPAAPAGPPTEAGPEPAPEP